MYLSTTTAAAVAVALALGSAHPASAQNVSSSATSRVATSSRTASSTSIAPSSSASGSASGSTDNPLIPSTVSTKCQSFLTYLNSHADIATCTAPLLSAVSLFQASSASQDYSTDDASIQDALAGLCYSDACDDALVRSLLTQFNANCPTELSAANSVVLGSYDALYVLTPLRDAVCSTDTTADFCINDISKGTMPAGSVGANATAVVSSIASSYAAAATASIDTGVVSSASASASISASSAAAVENATTFGNVSTKVVQSVPVVQQNTRILAAQSTYDIEVPSPASLYIQVAGAIKRFARRQLSGESTWSSGSRSSSASSSTRSSASASASAAPSGSTHSSTSTEAASNSTESLAYSDDSTTVGVQSFDVPSILPDATTWSTTSLPFLFLSPNMSSTVLCSQCTKSILSAYVAWESRMPYALGLANSPLLQGQGDLWTATGEKCGSGFLESVAQQAGESDLTGGAASVATLVHGAGLAGVLVFAALALAA